MQIFHNPNYNFVRWRWHALILSWIVIAAGIGVICHQGARPRRRVLGRHQVILEFDDRPPNIDQIRTALDARKVGGGGQNIVVAAIRRRSRAPGDGAAAAHRRRAGHQPHQDGRRGR